MTNAKATYRIVPPPAPVRAVQDEWGLFDPEQAGMQAAVRTVREMKSSAAAAPDVVVPSSTPAVAPSRDIDESAHGGAHVIDDNDVQPFDMESPSRSEAGAMYRLECATRCPHCSKSIKTFRVFRLLRTQVSFTSTLPRKGYVIVCPECDGLLSTELSGLL